MLALEDLQDPLAAAGALHGPSDFHAAARRGERAYLAALEARSCKARLSFTTAAEASPTGGPSRTTRPGSPS